jgi:hypothetical protein
MFFEEEELVIDFFFNQLVDGVVHKPIRVEEHGLSVARQVNFGICSAEWIHCHQRFIETVKIDLHNYLCEYYLFKLYQIFEYAIRKYEDPLQFFPQMDSCVKT